MLTHSIKIRRGAAKSATPIRPTPRLWPADVSESGPSQDARTGNPVEGSPTAALLGVDEARQQQRLGRADQHAASADPDAGVPAGDPSGDGGQHHDEERDVPQRGGLSGSDLILGPGAAVGHRASDATRAEPEEQECQHGELNGGTDHSAAGLHGDDHQPGRAERAARRQHSSLES